MQTNVSLFLAPLFSTCILFVLKGFLQFQVFRLLSTKLSTKLLQQENTICDSVAKYDISHLFHFGVNFLNAIAR